MKTLNIHYLQLLRKSFLLTLTVFTFISAGFAQTTGIDLTEQSKLVTEIDVNGLKVLIKRRPNSQTVAAGLFFRGGVRNISAQNAGIEDFTLNVATTGSQKFPRETLRREIARTGLSIGSGVNYDYSAISMLTTRQSFERAWEIFTDVALHPSFAPEDVELTREAMLSSLRNQNDTPDSLLQVLGNKMVYANTSYANDPNGTIETITNLKAKDLQDYHQKSLETSRLLLVIVGDLDPAVLQKQIAETFGKLPRGNYKEQPLPTLTFSAPTVDVTSASIRTNYIQGYFAAPSLNNPDYYAMKVATSLLASLVYQEVRVKRNLSYAPNADMSTQGSNTGNIYVTAVDANRAIGVMLDEIRRLKSQPFSNEVLSDIRAFFLTNYYLDQETNIAQAGELARYELIGGGWRNSFEFLNGVQKVTPEDIQRVSNKYIKNLRFIVVGNPADINRQIFLTQGE